MFSNKKLFVFKKVFADEEEEEEEGVQDIRPKLLEQCKEHHCQKELNAYKACVERLSKDENTEKNCMAWYMDVRTCGDHCVGKKLFSYLK